MPKSDSQDFPPLVQSFTAAAVHGFHSHLFFHNGKCNLHTEQGADPYQSTFHMVTFHEIHSYSYMTSHSHLST